MTISMHQDFSRRALLKGGALTVAFALSGERLLVACLEAHHERRLRVGRAHQAPSAGKIHARAVDIDRVVMSTKVFGRLAHDFEFSIVRTGQAQLRGGLEADHAADRKPRHEVRLAVPRVNPQSRVDVQCDRDLVAPVHHQAEGHVQAGAESRVGRVLEAVEQVESGPDVGAVGRPVQVREADPGPAQLETDRVAVGADGLARDQRPVTGCAGRDGGSGLCGSGPGGKQDCDDQRAGAVSSRGWLVADHGRRR